MNREEIDAAYDEAIEQLNKKQSKADIMVKLLSSNMLSGFDEIMEEFIEDISSLEHPNAKHMLKKENKRDAVCMVVESMFFFFFKVVTTKLNISHSELYTMFIGMLEKFGFPFKMVPFEDKDDDDVKH